MGFWLSGFYLEREEGEDDQSGSIYILSMIGPLRTVKDVISMLPVFLVQSSLGMNFLITL